MLKSLTALEPKLRGMDLEQILKITPCHHSYKIITLWQWEHCGENIRLFPGWEKNSYDKR